MIQRRTALLNASFKRPKPTCRCGCGTVPKDGRYVRGHQLLFLHQIEGLSDLPAPTAVETETSNARALLATIFADAFLHKQRCKRKICLLCETDRRWARATADWGITSFIALCDYLELPWEQARAKFLATAY